MPTIVKAPGSADLLALVPSMVGFTPKNSVVLVAFRGKRTAGAMRFDLPTTASETAQKRIITTMVGMFCKLPDIESVVTVIYSDKSFGADFPEEVFAKTLNTRLERSGFGIRESLCRAANGWGSYFDDDVPATGYPLDDIIHSSVHEQIPAEARANDKIVPARVPDASAPDRARVAKRMEFYDRVATSSAKNGLAHDSVLAPACEPTFFAEDSLSFTPLELADNAALLIFMFQSPLVRDLVMLQWAFGFALGNRFWNDEETEADSTLIMGNGPRPDPERIDRGIEVLLFVTGMASDDHRPPLLCMLAWLSWSLGKSSRARVFLDEALGISPDYSMAQLLSTMLATGILPEWAFRDH